MEEDRDMQPEKRDCNASPTLFQYMVMWAADRSKRSYVGGRQI